MKNRHFPLSSTSLCGHGPWEPNPPKGRIPRQRALGAAAGALLLALVACGGGIAPAAPSAPPQPGQPAQPAPAAPAPEPQAPAAPAPAAAPKPATAPTSQKPKEPKHGGIFVVANRGDPPAAFDTMRTINFDLHTLGGGLNGNGNLVRPCRGNAYKVCGGVAESWQPNQDFTQWTFKIRDNIKWHDGKPFNAEDAKFWLELVVFGAKRGDKSRAPAIYKASMGNVQKVEALEENRVRVTLANPEPQYLFIISDARYSIAHPRHLMLPFFEKGQMDVTPLDFGVVSVGPFKLAKYEKGSGAQVRRHDLYWERDEKGRPLPYLGGIDWVFVRDPTAMDAAFRVGRLDGGARGAGHALTKERADAYARDLGDKVWLLKVGGAAQSLAFNTQRPNPLQDVRVRRAIVLWIDKEASIPTVSGGFGGIPAVLDLQNPFTSPDITTWPGWNRATREQDRAEAKRLMAEAGFPTGGAKVTLIVPRRWTDRGEFASGQLAGLGVDVKITLTDEAGWDRGRISLDFDMLYSGWVGVTIPEQMEFYLTRYSMSNYAAPKHEDPKIEEAFKQLKASAGLDQRVKLWRDLERYMILEQAYMVPIISAHQVIPYRSYVKGMPLPAEGIMNDSDFVTVWLDK